MFIGFTPTKKLFTEKELFRVSPDLLALSVGFNGFQ